MGWTGGTTAPCGRMSCPSCRRVGSWRGWSPSTAPPSRGRWGPGCRTVLRDGLKTRCGIERLKALPTWLCSAGALRPRVGCNAQPVRAGVCQRGASTRPGERTPGPVCPETLATPLVQRHVPPLEVWCHGAMRAWAQAGVFGKTVTGRVDATDRDTTAPSAGGGQATRTRPVTDQHGTVQASEVTVDGGQVSLLRDARTTMPLALKSAPSPAPETRFRRARVAPARTTLGGDTRRHHVVCDSGVWDGADLWWLAPPGRLWVVPATANMTVTAEARAHAAAGPELTRARRVPTVRPGQGTTASTARLATAVVGLTGLTTDDQEGTSAQGRQHHRRDGQSHPIHAVVVRPWPGRDYGPAGHTVVRTHASVPPPWPPVDDEDERRLIAHGWINERQPPWELGQPPQKTERAVRVHVLCTRLRFARATASRLQGEPEATGSAPVGWQRWRRHLLEQTRDKVMGCAQGGDAIFPLAAYALWRGAKRQDRPPGVGTRQHVLAKCRLTAQG